MNYLAYFFKSKSKFSVHSPYVYAFATKVLYNKAHFSEYDTISALRKKLRCSDTTIEVNDLGAGSKVMKTNIRSVKNILRYSVKDDKHAQLLFRMVKHYSPAVMLELGTSLGITTAYLALGNPEGIVHTVEGCTNTATAAKQNIVSLHLNNVVQHIGDFNDCLPLILQAEKHPTLVLIDGNHRLEPTLSYFNSCMENAPENTMIVLDDIRWSKEMNEAWEKIKTHAKSSVTVDLFDMGIVFYRPNQATQNFILRW